MLRAYLATAAALGDAPKAEQYAAALRDKRRRRGARARARAAAQAPRNPFGRRGTRLSKRCDRLRPKWDPRSSLNLLVIDGSISLTL